MDLYSRFLVQFLFALQHVFERMETFTFSTGLTRVTGYLRERSFAGALRGLGAVRDWSGGTRIGENLGAFNRDWGQRGRVTAASDTRAGEPDAPSVRKEASMRKPSTAATDELLQRDAPDGGLSAA